MRDIGLMAALEENSVHITTTQRKEELLQSYELLPSTQMGPQDLSQARLLLERIG